MIITISEANPIIKMAWDDVAVKRTIKPKAKDPAQTPVTSRTNPAPVILEFTRKLKSPVPKEIIKKKRIETIFIIAIVNYNSQTQLKFSNNHKDH